MSNDTQPEIRFPEFTDEWEQRKLGEVATRVTRKNKKLESTLPLTISAQFGLVDQNTFFNKQIASKDVSGYYLLKKGEFAYNKSYSNGYPWGAVKRLDKYDMGVLSTLYICFRPVDINSDFLASYYDTDRWYKEVSKHAAEGARNHGLLNIAASDFFETELMIPKNNNEQEKIADFFKSLDTTITLHQRKLDLLKETKKGFLQKMFPKNGAKVPEIRFPGFTEDWEERKFGLLFEKNLEKNKNSEFDASRTISIATMHFKEEGNGAAESSLATYKVLRVGDIAYEGHTSKQFAFGRFVLNDIGDGIMSPRFTTLRPTSERPISFWKQYIHYEPIMRHLLVRSTKNGTMMNELVIPDLEKESLLVPSESEQKQIGAFFDKLDETIALHQRKLDLLKETKKGFLQKMFV
ncbi:restriction endonuclease subunit S [Enterococcus casseliflavus]|uniref:Restriction endonuclease subunit S n=1 Tax=Enterococcus casseliflavus TaxID=37734 RepID=A0ABD5FQM8_ENTCA|nr:restriction endonuclease subunit S [Enterococcus casseliflavus]MDT2984381.1 restriction endonuclease subunit S [Enterococcus casseliflavus]